jgi:hypothetical protein
LRFVRYTLQSGSPPKLLELLELLELLGLLLYVGSVYAETPTRPYAGTFEIWP